MPFTSGIVSDTVNASTTARFSIPSILEAETGREFEHFTVTRVLINWMGEMASDVSGIITFGIRFHNENEAATVVRPSENPSADWLYHEEFMVKAGAAPLFNFTRDLGANRRARGSEQDLGIYVQNNHTTVALLHHLSGRALVLLR